MYVNTKVKFNYGGRETLVKIRKRGYTGMCLIPSALQYLFGGIVSKGKGQWIRVKYNRLGILLYADDVVLIGDSENTLQEILNITTSYANEFSPSFNKSECVVLIVNKPERGREDFSAHSASPIKMGSKLRGGGLHILSWDRAKLTSFLMVNLLVLYLLSKKSYSIFFYIFHYLKEMQKKVRTNFSENRQTS